MSRCHFRPGIAPADTSAALARLEVAILELDALPSVDRIWIRNALRARRQGMARTLDEGLGLSAATTRRKSEIERRRELFAELYRSLQPCTRWRASLRIALILGGETEPPPAAFAACAELRTDAGRPRDPRAIFRYMPSD